MDADIGTGMSQPSFLSLARPLLFLLPPSAAGPPPSVSAAARTAGPDKWGERHREPKAQMLFTRQTLPLRSHTHKQPRKTEQPRISHTSHCTHTQYILNNYQANREVTVEAILV